jgi:5-methylcytosine-specific restriction endonuclease McrA
MRVRQHAYSRTLKGRYVQLKYRALRVLKQDPETLITFEQYATILRRAKFMCSYCGKSMDGVGYFIDRRNSKKGYVKHNCRTCCATCNTMKGEVSLKEFLAKVRAIDMRQKAHRGQFKKIRVGAPKRVRLRFQQE